MTLQTPELASFPREVEPHGSTESFRGSVRDPPPHPRPGSWFIGGRSKTGILFTCPSTPTQPVVIFITRQWVPTMGPALRIITEQDGGRGLRFPECSSQEGPGDLPR